MTPPRSALYLPASNPRAIEKARSLAADLILLDLEDAVAPADKPVARDAAIAAARQGFGGRGVAIRINAIGTEWHSADVAAVAASSADAIVLPKAEVAADVITVARAAGKPLLAMIETPAGVYAAREIAAQPGVTGLIAGTNDLAAALRCSGRAGLGLALQAIVLAARASGVFALDGVFNRLDDPAGLEAEARDGRAVGFDGKTLIHPNQIDAANRAFGPAEDEIEDAHALLQAHAGGAQRFRNRMIEALHLEAARRTLDRAATLRIER